MTYFSDFTVVSVSSFEFMLVNYKSPVMVVTYIIMSDTFQGHVLR